VDILCDICGEKYWGESEQRNQEKDVAMRGILRALELLLGGTILLKREREKKGVVLVHT